MIINLSDINFYFLLINILCILFVCAVREYKLQVVLISSEAVHFFYKKIKLSITTCFKLLIYR